jgi:hypothetical protein
VDKRVDIMPVAMVLPTTMVNVRICLEVVI